MSYDGAREGIDLVYAAIVKYCDAYEAANSDKEYTVEFRFYLAGLDKALEIIDNYDLSKNLYSAREYALDQYAESRMEDMYIEKHFGTN